MSQGDARRGFTARDARYVGFVATLLGVVIGIGAARQPSHEAEQATLLMCAVPAVLTYAMLHGVPLRLVFAAVCGVYATVIAGAIVALS